MGVCTLCAWRSSHCAVCVAHRAVIRCISRSPQTGPQHWGNNSSSFVLVVTTIQRWRRHDNLLWYTSATLLLPRPLSQSDPTAVSDEFHCCGNPSLLDIVVLPEDTPKFDFRHLLSAHKAALGDVHWLCCLKPQRNRPKTPRVSPRSRAGLCTPRTGGGRRRSPAAARTCPGAAPWPCPGTAS